MKHYLCSLLAVVLVSQVIQATTFVVDTAVDELDPISSPNSRLSLREAVRDLGQATGTICFAPNLTGQDITLESRLFLGASGGRIIIDGSTTNGRPPRIVAGDGVTGSGFIRARDRDVRLLGLVIDGAGIADTGVSVLREKLELSSVEITGCTNIGASVSDGEAEYRDCYFHHNAEAIRLNGSVAEIDRCLIAFHRRAGAVALGMTADRFVRFKNCTFAENQAPGPARGVLSFGGTDVAGIILHCSFVDNGGYAFSSPSSALAMGNLFARNTLDASEGETVSVLENEELGATSLGYNLSDNPVASFDDPSDLTVTNANISRLGDYGGNLMCCFPYANSAAVDGGIPDRVSPLLFRDIRGFLRLAQTTSGPSTNVMDIGAVEVNPNGTIEVINTAGSNSGSLALALAAATNDTNHIVIRTPLGQNTFNFLTKRVLGGDRNYNIDGTRSSFYVFKSNTSDEELFEVGDGSISGTTASFDGISFNDFEADSSGVARGVISLRSGCRASFHRCTFDHNQTAVKGVVDSAGDLFFNESAILNSYQVSLVSGSANGGSAVRSTGGSVTAWNSTFGGNVAEKSGSNGGAIRLSSLSRGSFRNCTFTQNEVWLVGSAIYAEDSSLTGVVLELDQCTFGGNLGNNGCVAFEDRMKARISGCLFTGNQNGGNLTTRVSGRDLYVEEPESVMLELGFPSWTDSPEVSLDFIAPGQRGVPIRLAPLAQWGGAVQTTPILRGTNFDREILDRVGLNFEPRDALNEISKDILIRAAGQSTLSYTHPGAVQRKLDFSEVLTTSFNGIDDENRLRLVYRGKFGLRWRVEIGSTLDDFTPTDLVVTASSIQSRTVLVPLVPPSVALPERVFVRLVEER